MRFSLLLLPLFIFAHDIWIEKQADIFTLQYGHLHLTQDHKGHKVIPYSPQKIKEIICKHDTKTKNLKSSNVYPLRIQNQCDTLYITLDNGYFTKTPFGTKNLPKNRVKMPLKSWRSIESVKRIGKNKSSLLSTGLEIVLLKRVNKIDEKATVQLFYNKKPIKNIPVAYDGKVRGLSNKEGKINIRIKHSGIQNIQATFKQISSDTKLSDETIRTSTLNFMVE